MNLDSFSAVSSRIVLEQKGELKDKGGVFPSSTIKGIRSSEFRG